jgi:hypothetical protein
VADNLMGSHIAGNTRSVSHALAPNNAPQNPGFWSCTLTGKVGMSIGTTTLDAVGIIPGGGNVLHGIQFGAGGWPWSHTAHYQVEGAPGPSPLGTGEGESSRLLRIHAGSCQPLSLAVHSDSISTVPCMPV